MITIKIYTLTNPIDDCIFYVGKTIDLETRLKSHISEANSNKTTKDAIIKYIFFKKKRPIIDEIDSIDCFYTSDEDYVNEMEVYWMHQIKAWGWHISNVSGMKQLSGGRRMFSDKLEVSFADRLAAFLKLKKSEINKFITDVMNADNLSEIEKDFLIDGRADKYNDLIAIINKKYDLDCKFIVDNYSILNPLYNRKPEEWQRQNELYPMQTAKQSLIYDDNNPDYIKGSAEEI